MKKLCATFLCLCVCLAGSAALAAYPEKPVTLIVPWTTGGAGDLAGRTLAQTAQKYLGQPVMVVNKPGASGVTGSTFVYNAPADGYTLLITRPASHAINPAYQGEKLSYDWSKFTWLGLFELTPYVFAVHKDSPIKSMKDLVETIKAKPGTMRFSQAGLLTTNTLGPQLLCYLNQIPLKNIVGVPFNSDGDAVLALLGKHVEFQGVPLVAAINSILNGDLRALGLVAFEPVKGLENVPPVDKIGYPDLAQVAGFTGIAGPPDMPKEVVDKWTEVLKQVASDKEWQDMLRKLGNTPRIQLGDEGKAFVGKQIETYKKVFEEVRKDKK